MKRLVNLLLCIILLSNIPTLLQAQFIRNGVSESNALASGNIHRPNFQAFLIKADNLFRKGQHIEALLQLDNAVEIAPQHPEVYLHRAILKFRLGMTNEARKDVEMAFRFNPVGPALFGIEGAKQQLDLLAFYPEKSYQHLAWQQQLSPYESVLDSWYEQLASNILTDDRAEVEVSIIHLEAALAAMNERKFKVALAELEQLTLIRVNNAVVYDLKGLVFLELGDLETAQIQFHKALALNPKDAMTWYNYARLQSLKDETALAVDYLDRAILLQPELSIAYFDRGYAKKLLDDMDGAIEDYSAVIELEELNFLAAYFNRALVLKKVGRLSEALNDLNTIKAIDYNNPLVWKTSGNIQLLSGAYNQAIADFTKAIELDNDFGEAYFNRGVAHLLNHNALTACIDFEQSAQNGYQRANEKRQYFCAY